jgi:hypothetical protein
MKITSKLFLTALLGSSLVCTDAAFGIEAAITADTSTLSTAPQGAATTMVVGLATNRRIFLRFAIQQAPASSPRLQDQDGPLPIGLRSEEVTRAVLRMYANVIASGPVDLRIRPVTSAWTEADLKTTLLPTWDTSTVSATVQVTAANQYVHFDVTSLVKSWLKFAAGEPGGLENFGLVIESADSVPAAAVTFDTKESTTNFYESVLEIFVEPATVPQRGNLSMGVFTAVP